MPKPFGAAVPARRPTAAAPGPRRDPAASDAHTGAPRQRPYRSGFCGPSSGPCQDLRRHCPGVARNGANAPQPQLACACPCHRR